MDTLRGHFEHGDEMMIQTSTRLGLLPISRFLLGGNPFSGVSHQNSGADRDMKRYFTTARIKLLLHEAEALGVSGLCARADNHIIRLLQEYWDEGGAIRWIAQTCPEFNAISTGVANAIAGGASAVYIHGGQMEYALANGREEDIYRGIEQIKHAGLPAGIAGHIPPTHHWANEHLQLDFHMCSYYHPTVRTSGAGHIADTEECFDESDRDAMVTTIARLRAPVIHYKILAAGRTPPSTAFAFAARHLRLQDAVCVGVYPKDHPSMLAVDLQLFTDSLEHTAAGR